MEMAVRRTRCCTVSCNNTVWCATLTPGCSRGTQRHLVACAPVFIRLFQRGAVPMLSMPWPTRYHNIVNDYPFPAADLLLTSACVNSVEAIAYQDHADNDEYPSCRSLLVLPWPVPERTHRILGDSLAPGCSGRPVLTLACVRTCRNMYP
jgi:hypothetical protein